MDALPDFDLSITPTEAELAQLDDTIKSLGGVHVDAVCSTRVHKFVGRGDPVHDTGCGNELIYEIPYAWPPPKLMQGTPAGKSVVTLCAVCDGLILKPRFLARKVS